MDDRFPGEHGGDWSSKIEKSVELAEPAWDVRLPCRPSGTKKYI
jgi:hypothetical protein